MNISNEKIADILKKISFYLEMENVSFKPQAYLKAARAIEELDKDVNSIYLSGGLEALEKIPGVGVSIAEKIEELIKTGRLKYFEDYQKKYPIDLDGLMNIEGLGPKTILELYRQLKIKNLNDLESAAKSGAIAKLAGFGQKSQENILKSLEFAKKYGGRFVLGFVMPKIQEIKNYLETLPAVKKIDIAGSTRRMKETIGDLDILVVSNKPLAVMDYFVKMPGVSRVYAKGETKSSINLENGLDVDLRVIPENSYGAALAYFTGSKEHNIAIREIAIKKGYKLNEYGLFDKKNKQIAGKTEEEIYHSLGLDFIEPEMRENRGEIKLAAEHNLPKIIGYNDLMGDLQIQTNWTDGENSIEEIVEAAIKKGLKYIVITDHSKRLAMAHGLDEKRLLQQGREIDKIQKKFGNKIKILKGIECDILKDGSMDLNDEVLSKLDVVGGAIHSYFNLSKEEQTERLKKAMRNKNVDIIFHPTGRVINKREAYELDLEDIFRTAKETGTILEIDAFPDRLDLKDEYVKKALEFGIKFSIDSDAHSIKHFDYLRYGIANARRGWAGKNNIINAWPLEKMLSFLK
jgi:DNA polymerase (family 10)